MRREEKAARAEELAVRVLSLAKDSLIINLRFLDAALAALIPVSMPGLGGAALAGDRLYYDALWLLKEYEREAGFAVRLLLHALLHCIFSHPFGYDKLESRRWDLAADLAVENTILELKLPGAALAEDVRRAEALRDLEERAGGLTAEKLYRCFRLEMPETAYEEELVRLFKRDGHQYWKPREEQLVTKEQWKRIGERIRADLKSFSKGKTEGEGFEKNLGEAVRDRYDYGELLRRFTVMGEELMLNEDEFDYIYYTYGLEHYADMPLIEPLEYREVKKVREFAVVLDTSASCRGETVRAFLNKTYSILKGTENFFHTVNIHIIQCDHEVRNDTKITNDREFDAFIRHGSLQGFGSTDFGPALEYVEALSEKGEFENLRGLIYFTDGYGIYPVRKPPFECMFVFLEEDERRPEIPPWAVKAVLDGGLEFMEEPERGTRG